MTSPRSVSPIRVCRPRVPATRWSCRFLPLGQSRLQTRTPAPPWPSSAFAPEGDVPLVPQLSVTFNLPMVPLTSHQELAAEDIPVELKPTVPGRWRWVGSRTLLFEAGVDGSARMPMATEFSASISEGILSADGTKLAEPVSWTFRTPPPSLQYAWPTGGPGRARASLLRLLRPGHRSCQSA